LKKKGDENSHQSKIETYEGRTDAAMKRAWLAPTGEQK
jgi:hypothetical protein